jgi:hypothetical protein
MKRVLVPIALTILGHATFGMAGGPMFCVPQRMTSMTVELLRSNVEVASPGFATESERAVSQRVLLTGRYGIAPYCDIAASLGTADLSFSNLPAGYTDFSASWSLGWGASLRGGLPLRGGRGQVVAAVHYFGFEPKGEIHNGIKSIDSKYVWHELSPVVTAGWQVGPVVPYLGVSKPFLFGRRDVKVVLNGQEYRAAGGASNYTDSEQPVRGLLGVEWRLPEGYSLTAEAAATSKGVWTMGIGMAQVLR